MSLKINTRHTLVRQTSPWVLGVTLGRCSLDVAMTIVTVIAVNHDAYAVGLLLQLLGHTSQRLKLKLNLTSG